MVRRVVGALVTHGALVQTAIQQHTTLLHDNYLQNDDQDIVTDLANTTHEC